MQTYKQMKSEIHKCIECNSDMVFEKKEFSIPYKEHTFTENLLAWWCMNCDEGIISGWPMHNSERQYVSFKESVDGYPSITDQDYLKKYGYSDEESLFDLEVVEDELGKFLGINKDIRFKLVELEMSGQLDEDDLVCKWQQLYSDYVDRVRLNQRNRQWQLK